MSLWQVLIHNTTIWNSPSGRYVPEEKKDKLFSSMENVFSIAGNILIVGFGE